MIRDLCSSRSARRLALAALLGLAATPAAAQIGIPASRPMEFQPRIGAGYVVNAPNQFVGVSAHWVSGVLGGLGLYVDVKFDLDSPEDRDWFLDTMTVAYVEENLGHPLFSRAATWTSVNVALMRPLGPQFVVYGGAGYSDGRHYREYWDMDARVHETGFYWVRDEEASGARLNLLAGAMFQISSIFALQFGLESQPSGITVGASYLIPLR
jgi:hypothetical protein